MLFLFVWLHVPNLQSTLVEITFGSYVFASIHPTKAYANINTIIEETNKDQILITLSRYLEESLQLSRDIS